MASQISFSATIPFNADDGAITRTSSWSLNDFTHIGIPVSATITGIKVKVNVGMTGLSRSVGAFTVSNGPTTSNPKGINESAWTQYPSYGIHTAGDDSYLWESAWTPEQINTQLSVSFTTHFTAYWDSVAVEVFFTESPFPYLRLEKGSIILSNGKISI
jgi:hypothetical protein|tara:strand:+ start:34 stop:510 length:477 start_codon:yes stop_codon:yes gene_type:complete